MTAYGKIKPHKPHSSPIQTLLSVLEFHQIKAYNYALVDYTTGREFHPALKNRYSIMSQLYHYYPPCQHKNV